MRGVGGLPQQPTLKSVATEAGVSVATVSYVLRGLDKSISEETTQRVLEHAERLGYSANPAARAMRTGKTGLILLLLGMPSDPWSIATADAVNELADRAGRAALIYSGRSWAETIQRTRPDVAYIETADGGEDVASLGELAAHGHRVIAFSHRPLEAAGFDVIHSDPGDTFDEILDAVLAHSDDVAFLTPERYALGRDPRFSAYHRAVIEARVRADRTTIYDGSRVDAFQQAIRLLSGPDRPAAVVSNTDYAGLAVTQAAQALGLRVPQDLLVSGIGDTTDAAHALPMLTTAGPEDFHHRLAQLILRTAAGDVPLGTTHHFPWRVLHRTSTTPEIGPKTA